MPHRILVVEDDPPTRRHLVRAIEAHPELDLVRAAGSVAEGRSALAEEQPDVLLTDIGLPDGTGIDLIRAIREVAPKAISMAVTALGDEKTVISAIEAGASGYLLKDGSHDEIGGAVLELVAGGSPISPSIARHVLQRLHREDADAREESENDAPTLTSREHEVLTLIAKGFSFPEIAELLEISAHTVTTHVRHIYEKLEVNSRGSAVYEAVNLGIIQMD
ncbi:MAG: response regulator transcription factor [Myxococcales bacterium]|nr:response regulator transcription factor [Myxococcales bacterium]